MTTDERIDMLAREMRGRLDGLDDRIDGLAQRISEDFKAVHTSIATLGKAVETITNGQQATL